MLTNIHPAPRGIHREDDAEMDRADRIGVVVQQADELEIRFPIGDQLLGPFATKAGQERIGSLVHRIQVPADADAGLAMQTWVAARIGPMHEKDTLFVAHDDVGDELLVARNFFSDRAIQVAAMRGHRRAEIWQRGGIGFADSMEVAATRHGVSGEYQDSLGHRFQVYAGAPVR